CQYGYVMPFSF
nr:immunoglobulin light chain junction region [Macaca mulatta]